jgi:hypothetical protein
MTSILLVQRLQHRKTIWLLTRPKRYRKTNKTLNLFLKWCNQEFSVVLYDYEIEISWWLLASLIIEPIDVFVKMARQSGKTETVTLLVRFLIIFYRFITGTHLMAAFASPKGEQAKTDVDRVKKSITKLRDGWQVEDREFNAKTIRAYRFDELFAEIYTFSLSPTTQNESKTLNLLIVEESHKADHKKRSDELDSMLVSTNGPTFHFGVGCTVLSDFKRGCDGELPDSVSLIMPVERVVSDRRKKYEQTGDPKHLNYEHKYKSEVRKKGRQNPEIRRNYHLEDTVEEGNFVSRDRLLSCARSGLLKNGRPIPTDQLFFGADWARVSDNTWIAVSNIQNDILTWIKIPHLPYEQQIEMILADLKRPWLDGKPLFDRIVGVKGDSTGQGDMPMEYLQMHSGLPVGLESHVKFTLQSKNDMYLALEQAIFRDDGDSFRFSYPADHPLAAEFEEQMVALLRTYKGDGEYLSVSHPDEPDARDDAPDATALALFGAVGGNLGEIVFV